MEVIWRTFFGENKKIGAKIGKILVPICAYYRKNYFPEYTSPPMISLPSLSV